MVLAVTKKASVDFAADMEVFIAKWKHILSNYRLEFVHCLLQMDVRFRNCGTQFGLAEPVEDYCVDFVLPRFGLFVFLADCPPFLGNPQDYSKVAADAGQCVYVVDCTQAHTREVGVARWMERNRNGKPCVGVTCYTPEGEVFTDPTWADYDCCCSLQLFPTAAAVTDCPECTQGGPFYREGKRVVPAKPQTGCELLDGLSRTARLSCIPM